MFNTDGYGSRYFNSVIEKNGRIEKSSSNIDKIRAEFYYYSFLPEDIKEFFVKPENLTIDESIASYSMEKIKVKNCGELYVNGFMTFESMQNVLDVIIQFKEFCNKYEWPYKNTVLQSEYLVINKTYNRLLLLKNNEKEMLLFERIKNAYFKNINNRSTWNTVISHGDLCLSNVLWDDNRKVLKLIDPRGANNKDEIFMDEYYDFAKLSHSILGGYENILYDTSHSDAKLKDTFIKVLNNKKIDYKLLRIYEASLFLSMIPLHKDSKNRMSLFADKCDSILQEVGY